MPLLLSVLLIVCEIMDKSLHLFVLKENLERRKFEMGKRSSIMDMFNLRCLFKIAVNVFLYHPCAIILLNSITLHASEHSRI